MSKDRILSYRMSKLLNDDDLIKVSGSSGMTNYATANATYSQFTGADAGLDAMYDF